MVKMKLSEIKISNAFALTTPKDDKLNACRNYWKENHEQDRDIVVNKNNVLIDGYIQYLVLKENGVDEVEIKISTRRKKRWYRKNVKDWNIPHYRNQSTTYVYGVHSNSKNQKEFVWRVPKTWSELGWEDGLNIGDEILVDTKFGIKPVVVTKIEISDKCPVNMPVKRVMKRLNKQIEC